MSNCSSSSSSSSHIFARPTPPLQNHHLGGPAPNATGLIPTIHRPRLWTASAASQSTTASRLRATNVPDGVTLPALLLHQGACQRSSPVGRASLAPPSRRKGQSVCRERDSVWLTGMAKRPSRGGEAVLRRKEGREGVQMPLLPLLLSTAPDQGRESGVLR
jgi:hypothetical protein